MPFTRSKQPPVFNTFVHIVYLLELGIISGPVLHSMLELFVQEIFSSMGTLEEY